MLPPSLMGLFQIKCTWKCLASIINGDVALMLIESLFAEADKKGSRLLRGGSRPKAYISKGWVAIAKLKQLVEVRPMRSLYF